MNNNHILNWFAARRSIRHYRPEPISPDLIDTLLTAAVWAPSAHNRQPWRFVVVSGRQAKERLALAMGQQLRADLAADGLAPDLVEQDAGRSYRRLTGAPLLVVFCLTMTGMDHYPDERRQRHEWHMAVQSVAMAGQNLLLAAHTLGLGACWMCAPLFCPDVVRATLALPDDWQPQGLVTLGYPAETRHRDRRPAADQTLWLD